MLKREQLIKDITIHLTHLSSCVEVLGSVHFLDLNIAAEHFFEKLLNQVYSYNLINLNHSKLNAAAIDLADHSIGLAVQVTSDRRADKIQKTLDNFSKHGLGTKYKTLKVLIIGRRTGHYSTVKVPNGVIFSGRDDVIDNKSLIQAISKKTTPELQTILELIEREFSYGHPGVSVLHKSDSDALNDMRAYMDRPALQDRWSTENNYQDFGKSITGLIELFKAGRWQGQLVTKPQSKYQDTTLVEQLDTIYNQLRILRQLFQTHVKSGEINLKDNTCIFQLPQTEAVFDKLRNAINAGFNKITQPYNLAPLRNIS
ncbi:SMEK domain-containing protein [Pseudomonas sp. COW5]|uniref:SMEK domain-containing protein n=1 Tax=Pseudomonas sp. COW5 TaxID=2981253 RepID=UPI00224874AE|nr:SMEK domain-containing protein [Pseudomonas sp. COW5]MCX2546578.1 SMEK domain-containing protein [Pseudomonas sp. COW5]